MLLSNHLSGDMNYTFDIYNETIGAISDKHSPIATRRVTLRPQTLWHNNSILSQSVLNVSWDEDGEQRDWSATLWLTASALVCHFINTPCTIRISYESNHPCICDQNKLFKIVAKLIHVDENTPLPSCELFNTLAEQFSGLFLGTQILKIQSELIQYVNNVDVNSDGDPQTYQLTAFEADT